MRWSNFSGTSVSDLLSPIKDKNDFFGRLRWDFDVVSGILNLTTGELVILTNWLTPQSG